MTASSFVWVAAGRDHDLRSAAAALRAGMTTPTRDLLARTRRRDQFNRRAYACAVLAAEATELNLAESWAEEEPGNPDARLLWARVTAMRALHAEREDERLHPLLQIAERACRAAAGLAHQDPTPHVIALSLDRHRHRYRAALPAPEYMVIFGLEHTGPWDRWEEVMLRHAESREAGQHLLAFLATLPGGNVAGVRALGRRAASCAPHASALQLPPLYADVEYQVEDDPEDGAASEANTRRAETLRVLIEDIDQGKAFGTPDGLALRPKRSARDLDEASDPGRVARTHRAVSSGPRASSRAVSADRPVGCRGAGTMVHASPVRAAGLRIGGLAP